MHGPAARHAPGAGRGSPASPSPRAAPAAPAERAALMRRARGAPARATVDTRPPHPPPPTSRLTHRVSTRPSAARRRSQHAPPQRCARARGPARRSPRPGAGHLRWKGTRGAPGRRRRQGRGRAATRRRASRGGAAAAWPRRRGSGPPCGIGVGWGVGPVLRAPRETATPRSRLVSHAVRRRRPRPADRAPPDAPPIRIAPIPGPRGRAHGRPFRRRAVQRHALYEQRGRLPVDPGRRAVRRVAVAGVEEGGGRRGGGGRGGRAAAAPAPPPPRPHRSKTPTPARSLRAPAPSPTQRTAARSAAK